MPNLSDKLSSLQFTPKPQSPAFAGAVVNVPLAQVSKYQEKNYFLCDGSEYSETTYAELFAACGTQYNTGGETAGFFRVPNGPRSTPIMDAAFTDVAPNFTSVRRRSRFWQDALGTWYIEFWLNGSGLYSTYDPSVATFSYGSFDGITSEISSSGGHSIDASVDANTASSFEFISMTSSASTIFGRTTANITANRNTIFHGIVPLSSKPTDAAVSADSRFSTFDEALQFQPMIKVYDDASNISMSLADATATKTGAIRLDSSFAAGDGVYGLVTANKTQRKNLTSDFGSSTGVMTDLTFNNLVIGKLYYVVFNPLYVFGVADASTTLTIKNGVTNIGIMRFGSSTSGATFANSYVTDSFIANATDINFTVGSSNGSYHGDNSINETHAILIEDNQTIKTTDFT